MNKTQARLLALVIMVLATLGCIAQQKATKKYIPDEYGFVVFGTNKLEYSKVQIDTIEMEDPKTHDLIKRIIKRSPSLTKIDGKEVADLSPAMKNNSSPAEYLYRKLKKDLAVLEDGCYDLGIMNLIVDDKGKNCGFMFRGVSGNKNEDSDKPKQRIKIDKQTEDKIFNRMCEEFVAFPTWLPPVMKGKKVPSASNLFGDNWRPPQLKVLNHKVYFKTQEAWVQL